VEPRGVIRAIIGFFVAPLVILPMIFILVLLGAPLPLTLVGEHSLGFRLREGLGIAALALLVGYFVTLVAAVPMHIQFVRRGWKRSWMYGALGALLGVTPWLIYAVTIYLSDLSTRDLPPHVVATFIGLSVACGVPAALLFWLIAVKA
jgi:hypothetical protein